MVLRILSFFLLLFSVIFMPFWVSVLLGLGAMAYFPIYAEVVVISLLLDLLYGAPEPKFFGITFVSLIISTITLIGIELLKTRLKYYPKHYS